MWKRQFGSGANFTMWNRLNSAAAIGACTLIATLLVPPAAPAQTTVERDLFVSVLNKADAPVMTLAPADFIVKEDGRTREVLRARRATDPIDLAILIDTSQALGRQVADTRRGIEALLAAVAGHAEVSLIGVGDRPTILTPYSGDAETLKQGVGKIFAIPGAGATMLEAIEETLAGLAKRPSERAAIVVVWAGGVEFNSMSQEALLRRLADSRVTLHVVTVGNAVPPDIATPDGRAREVVFDSGSRASGGRRQNVLTSMGLPDVMTKLGAELLGQYRITYARPDTLIPPKSVEVSVRPPDLTVRSTPVILRKKDAAK